MLSGSCRLGKRAVGQVFDDLFGLPIVPGGGVRPGAADGRRPRGRSPRRPWTYARDQNANVDETGWTEGKTKAWLWVAVTEPVVAFLIRPTRGRGGVRRPGRADSAGVLTTDRYPVYAHLPGERRQVCWAHLRRDFQAMIDRKNAGSGGRARSCWSTRTSCSTTGSGCGTGR